MMDQELWFLEKILKLQVSEYTILAGACMSAKTWQQQLSLVVRKPFFLHMRKTKTQISCAVTAQLISAYDFVTQKVQSLYC